MNIAFALKGQGSQEWHRMKISFTRSAASKKA
jgi:hypothetical protein